MKYLLGIDFGGGASKATLLSEDARIVATNTVEYPTLYPQNGWVEQNPDDWCSAVIENVKSILNKSHVNPDDIVALSLDAATHTAVLTDENFNVLRPSIYWTDTRTVAQVERLKEMSFIPEHFYHNPDTIWTLPQIMWVKENEPHIFSKIKRIMFAKDYVRHMLTGDYVTDYIDAEGSMLFDFTTLEWSDEMCALTGLDKNLLPKVVKPTDIVGRVTAEAASKTGLSEKTAVICGTTDTVMEVLAAGAVKCGQMTVKLATAGRICVITDKAYPDQNLVNYSHIIDGIWYPGTATKSCAASYRWYRDTFGGDYKSLDEGAEKIPLGADGLMFHPYLNGELTPYADPALCGSFIGIRARHTKAHFTRAVLEGVAMSLVDCKRKLEEIGIPHGESAVIIGGGASGRVWRQIVSDALGITLVQKKNSDSSFGSAMLAGYAAGIFESLEEATQKCSETVSVTKPIAENTEKYSKLFDEYKRVHDALAPIYHERLGMK